MSGVGVEEVRSYVRSVLRSFLLNNTDGDVNLASLMI